MSDVASDALKNCWEIINCERHAQGRKVEELGECAASRQGMGHSCWVVAGTLCGDSEQDGVIEKYNTCTRCEVFSLYHRSIGKIGDRVKEFHPVEDLKYRNIIYSWIVELGRCNDFEKLFAVLNG